MQALDCSRGWETPPSPHGQLKTEDSFIKKGKKKRKRKKKEDPQQFLIQHLKGVIPFSELLSTGEQGQRSAFTFLWFE